MAGTDNILYHAQLTAAGQTVNASLIYGSSTIRTNAYGSAKLKTVRAVYTQAVDDDTPIITVEYINSNWVRSNKLSSAPWSSLTAFAKNTKNCVEEATTLIPNSAFTIAVTENGGTVTGAVDVYILFTIEYSGVTGYDPETITGGTRVTFTASTGVAVTTVKNQLFRIASFDLLDPGITYVINELTTTAAPSIGAQFVVIEGLANQLGLNRCIPLLSAGSAAIIPSNAGTVAITKQSFTVGVIGAALSGVMLPIQFEMIASKNSIGA